MVLSPSSPALVLPGILVVHLKDTGLMIRCDGATSPFSERPRELIIGIDDLLTTGADAAAAMYFPGIVNGHGSTIYFPRLAAEAHRWNIPVMAEALPYGFEEHPAARAVEFSGRYMPHGRRKRGRYCKNLLYR